MEWAVSKFKSELTSAGRRALLKVRWKNNFLQVLLEERRIVEETSMREGWSRSRQQQERMKDSRESGGSTSNKTKSTQSKAPKI